MLSAKPFGHRLRRIDAGLLNVPGPVSGGRIITCKPPILFEKMSRAAKNPQCWLLHQHRPQAIDRSDAHIRLADPHAEGEQEVVKQRIDGRRGAAQRFGKRGLYQLRAAERQQQNLDIEIEIGKQRLGGRGQRIVGRNGVVSRMWWKLASSALRACNVCSGQAARSRDIGTRG